MVVPESMGHEKDWQGLFSVTQFTEMRNECRDLSQEELDLNLNSVYNVCDTWRLLHDS